jgi:hypothetical protein
LTDALNAGVSASFDQVAAQLFPTFQKFQKMGEGLGETLVRVASNYVTLDAVLASVGKTFGATGAASVTARESMIELAGGIDELANKTASFADNFLTEAERLAPVQRYVAEQLAAMGLANVRSRDAFKQYVLGLDLTSEAQRKQYVALMDLQDAFAEVYPEIEDTTMTLTKAKSALTDAYNAEVDAIGATIDRMGSFATSLRELNKSALLGSLSPLSPQQKYAEARAQYEAVAAAARGGDEKAQDRYQDVYNAFLQASRVVYASGAEYQLDFSYAQAMTAEMAQWADVQVSVDRAQLDALKAQVSGIIEVNKSVLSVRDALLQYNAALNQATAPLPAGNGGIQYYEREGWTNDAARANGSMLTAILSLNERIDSQTKVIEGLRSDQQKQTGDQLVGYATAANDTAVVIAKAITKSYGPAAGETRVTPQ